MSVTEQATAPAVHRPSPRLVGAVCGGTLLNPLNSSMIAVALVSLGASFGVSIATTTWLVSGFYVGGALGMPLMGRLADRFGPRRVFCGGLVLVGVTGLLAPLAPSIGCLLTARLVQALGTSAAYPAGLAIFRRASGSSRAPAGALGAISIASSVSAAVGPVVGGLLVGIGGWPAIFLVNAPLAAAGLVLALFWLPVDTRTERGAQTHGIKVQALLTRRLLAVYAQFTLVNVAFYGVFFGLPLWLEQVRGDAPDTTGLLLLPVAGVGVLATPIAARLVERRGPRLSLILGSVVLLVGALLLLRFEQSTSVAELLVVGAVLGVPNGFNNLGLQAALYEAAPGKQVGAAGGLFQTFRYIGAIVATSLVALTLGGTSSNDGLRELAAIIAVLSALLILMSVRA